jgi:fructose-bisphosphate aldolase class I
MSQELVETAQAIGARGRGILAADESTPTIKKRFDSINAESTQTSRRDYREMLFRTAAMAEHISGVILFDETLRQDGSDGTPLAEVIKSSGAIPGIKVDKGAKPLAGAEGEKITEGLDGLRDRLREYYELGARFAKWRAVINIDDVLPSAYCVRTNAHALARYAALCQEAGLVPIVEPEVMMEGAHDIDRCFEVTEFTLNTVFDELIAQRILLEGVVLKPNMVLSGLECETQAGVEEVAEMTVRCLKQTVPAALPSICFLSGGQSDLDATAHLNAMNAGFETPWNLSFSFGRALQAAPLKAWGGDNENIPAAQSAFAHRACMNGMATKGEWSPDLEQQAAE